MFFKKSILVFSVVIFSCLNAYDKDHLLSLQEPKKKDFRNLDLTGADLQNKDLSGKKFVGVNFNNARFEKANLRSSVFIGCSFIGAIIRDAKFLGSGFKGCALTDLNFTKWNDASVIVVEDGWTKLDPNKVTFDIKSSLDIILDQPENCSSPSAQRLSFSKNGGNFAR